MLGAITTSFNLFLVSQKCACTGIQKARAAFEYIARVFNGDELFGALQPVEDFCIYRDYIT